MRSLIRSLIPLGALLLSAAGCAPDISQTGAMPSPERLSQIKPGLTKSDVLALVGSPSTTGTFGDNTWYYISAKLQSVAFFSPDELDRQIIQIDFDNGGSVKQVLNRNLANGLAVDMSGKTTPSAGRDLGFFEELVGNVGRFNKKKDKDKDAGG